MPMWIMYGKFQSSASTRPQKYYPMKNACRRDRYIHSVGELITHFRLPLPALTHRVAICVRLACCCWCALLRRLAAGCRWAAAGCCSSIACLALRVQLLRNSEFANEYLIRVPRILPAPEHFSFSCPQSAIGERRNWSIYVKWSLS